VVGLNPADLARSLASAMTQLAKQEAQVSFLPHACSVTFENAIENPCTKTTRTNLEAEMKG